MSDSEEEKPIGWELDEQISQEAARWTPNAADGVDARLKGIACGFIATIPSPFPELDRLVQPTLPGSITLLCGDPGSSKSLLTIQLFGYLIRANIHADLYELESDRTYHAMRYLAQRSGVAPITRIDWTQQNPDHAKAIIDNYRGEVAALGEHLFDCIDGDIGYRGLLAWVKQRCEAGARLIGIDPITVADPEGPPWVADRQFIAALGKILRHHGCAAWIVTHPKKGKSNAPSFDDLAGGAAWARFTNAVLWLKRPNEPEMVKLACGSIVACNRTLRVVKARDGVVSGVDFAVDFSNTALTFSELGLVKERLDCSVPEQDVNPFM